MIGIVLDDAGVCNNCAAFDELLAQYPSGDDEAQLQAIAEQIRRTRSGGTYDCVVGLSGGTDSTYTLYETCRLGLRPLAVHFDNGWNSDVAVRNMKAALTRLDVDLDTYVVDWPTFRDIQLSFLRASVSAVEMPTDLAIRAVMYRAAARVGARHIISGNCFRAEGIVPHEWGYKDARLVRSIQRRFGTESTRRFPTLTPSRWAWNVFVRRIRLVRMLNHVDYRKASAKATLAAELGWEDYGGHHHESIYTRFFQSYLARVKFHQDRRKVSLSAQVRLGHLSRDEALLQSQGQDYDAFQLEDDKKFVAKKLEVSRDELDRILAKPVVPLLSYPNHARMIRGAQRIFRVLRFTRAGAGGRIFQSGGPG